MRVDLHLLLDPFLICALCPLLSAGMDGILLHFQPTANTPHQFLFKTVDQATVVASFQCFILIW